MAYASIQDARDDILTLFKTAWDAQAAPVPPVAYPNVTFDRPPDNSPWARVSVKHNTGAQATVGGSPGNRRFRRFGMVVVELFTPTGQGLTASDKYAKVAYDAFEGKSASPGGAFFYNVRVNEVGEDGAWFHTNVIAEFQWDEVK